MKSQEKLPRAMADYGKRFEQKDLNRWVLRNKNRFNFYFKELRPEAVCQFLNAGRGNPNG